MAVMLSERVDSNNIGQIAYLQSEQDQVKHIYFGGSFIRGGTVRPWTHYPTLLGSGRRARSKPTFCVIRVTWALWVRSFWGSPRTGVAGIAWRVLRPSRPPERAIQNESSPRFCVSYWLSHLEIEGSLSHLQYLDMSLCLEYLWKFRGRHLEQDILLIKIR